MSGEGEDDILAADHTKAGEDASASASAAPEKHGDQAGNTPNPRAERVRDAKRRVMDSMDYLSPDRLVGFADRVVRALRREEADPNTPRRHDATYAISHRSHEQEDEEEASEHEEEADDPPFRDYFNQDGSDDEELDPDYDPLRQVHPPTPYRPRPRPGGANQQSRGYYVPRPKPYDGSADELRSPTTFLKEYEFYLRMVQQARHVKESVKVLIFPSCLAGRASRWVMNLDDKVRENWPKLRKAFIDRFTVVDHLQLNANYRTRKQGLTETVARYTDDMELFLDEQF